MSEQSRHTPDTNEPNRITVSPEFETTLAVYRSQLLAEIERSAPLPYSETDIDNAPYDDEVERMLGYNQGRDETLVAVRKVLGFVSETTQSSSETSQPDVRDNNMRQNKEIR